MTAAARAATPKIIIAGAPASGKGTQCELLKETYVLVCVWFKSLFSSFPLPAATTLTNPPLSLSLNKK